MNTSKYRYKISIQKPFTKRQSNGQPKTTYEDFLVNINCGKRDITGQKTTDDKQVKNIYTKAFTIAYRDSIETNMQVIFRGTKFKINFISELGFKDELELFCENI